MELTFLAPLSSRALELGELNWWSSWATLSWLDRNSYMLSSMEFAEPFFNRVGFLSCAGLASSAEKAEHRFRALGLDPVLLVHEKCSAGMKALTKTGYRKADTMTVLASTRSPRSAGRSQGVKISLSGSAREWSRVYLRAFYGDERLLPQVTRIVRRLNEMTRVTLLEAKLEGAVAGVLAIYRTPGLAGVYCVGTLPKFRRMGVAGALVDRAKEVASSEGRRLFLQTLESDGTEPFYLARGFTRLYRKHFMVKEN